MEIASVLKTIGAAISLLIAAAGVAWTAGATSISSTKSRVEVIEEDHRHMRHQITDAQIAAKNAESLSEYTAKQVQNLIFIQGYEPPPLPPVAVPGRDGGVQWQPRDE